MQLARTFASVDLRSLALFRMALGAVLIADLAGRFALVDTLYSNDGVLSNHFSLFRPLAPYQFSLYAIHSSTRDVMIAFIGTLIIYALFTIGYRTRLFHFLSFVCVTSLHARNLMAELPSDVPLHLLVGWSLLLPLGERFSLDAVRRSLAKGGDASVADLNLRAPPSTSFVSFAVFGMFLQLSAMHLFAAVHQSGAAWQDGTALYYALRQKLWVTDLGAMIGREAPAAYLESASFAYRIVEVAIGVLIVVPVSFARRASIALLLLFHLASRALWNFGPYEWVMLAGVPLLITTRDWQSMVSFYRARKPELEVVFDAQSGLAFGFCRLMKPLDALSRLTFVAGEVELVAVRDRKSSRVYSGGASVRRLLRALPFTGWASFALGAPGIAWLVDRIFDFVARRRSGIGAWFGMKPIAAREGAPSIRFDETARHAIARAFVIGREALAVMLLVVCGVALGRDMNDESAPSGLEAAIYRLVAYPRMYQRWGLFAPDPERRPGTLVAEAETAGGTKLDPFTGQPAHAAAPRPEPLMGSYFTSISQPSRAIYVNELREYVRRRGERGGPSDQLVRFNVDWIESPIAAPIPRDEPAPEIAAVPITPRRITSGP